LLPEPKTPSS